MSDSEELCQVIRGGVDHVLDEEDANDLLRLVAERDVLLKTVKTAYAYAQRKVCCKTRDTLRDGITESARVAAAAKPIQGS
jgi:hypothetical protein